VFTIHSKKEDADKYVVFANLWDSDGDVVGKDDCFVKGNAMGLEEVDYSSGDIYTLTCITLYALIESRR